MSRYIALLRYTQKGAENIKASPDRAHHFNQLAEKVGVKIEGQFWTTGRYDGVLIIDAATDQKALHMLAELAAAGNVRTETMRAFNHTEFADILK
jgi:uncharacterized protein with GYD domain